MLKCSQVSALIQHYFILIFNMKKIYSFPKFSLYCLKYKKLNKNKKPNLYELPMQKTLEVVHFAHSTSYFKQAPFAIRD